MNMIEKARKDCGNCGGPHRPNFKNGDVVKLKNDKDKGQIVTIKEEEFPHYFKVEGKDGSYCETCFSRPLKKAAAISQDAKEVDLRADLEKGGWTKKDVNIYAAAHEMLAALQAQSDANFFAEYASSNTKDGEPIKKEWMDKADVLFAKARKLRYAAVAKAEGRAG